MNRGLQQGGKIGRRDHQRLLVRSGSGVRGGSLAGTLLFFAVAVSACGPATVQGSKGEPAYLESIEGSNQKRVVVTPAAAKRIGLQTTPVREELITRTRTIGGEIVAGARTVVRLRLSASELGNIDRDRPALVVPRAGANPNARSLTARAIAARTVGGAVVTELDYALDRSENLTHGERVLVKLPLVGGEVSRKLVPYAALLYDTAGLTWAYTEVAPLAFVRSEVTVDFIEGDLAMLSAGPPAGTLVVAVGVTELFGTEFKVGK